MSQYAAIAPTFWNGETGKKIRNKGVEAQVVALYLVSSPHRNALGLYYLPKILIAHEVGLPFEGASKALQSLIEEGFCAYDEASEVVWVYEMAKYQIGRQLKKGDNRVKWINEKYAELPKNPFLKEFYSKYADAFHIEKRRENKPLQSHLEAPSKPDSDTDSDTDTDTATTAEGSGEDIGSQPNPTPIKKIISIWNRAIDEYKSTMPKVMSVNPGTGRYNHLRARFKEYPDLKYWQAASARAAQSDFLNGRVKSRDRPMSFDWIIQSSANLTKVLEGKYDNHAEKNGSDTGKCQGGPAKPSKYDGLERTLKAD